MTRVCLLGSEDVNLRYELLSRETARDALVTYDLREPFANAIGLETVSLGAAVALLNDLDWYLVRFVDEAMVLEPSVSEDEWLSRDLATAIRDDDVGDDESSRYLAIYGVESDRVDEGSDVASDVDESDGDSATDAARGADGETDATGADQGGEGGTDATSDGPPRLVEPMYVTRTGQDVPDYDLRDVDETLVERVTEDEFGA